MASPRATSTFLDELDVVIVGSGPIGAVFARTLVDKGLKVLMIDMGEQATRRVGDHKKNSVVVQKDISSFTNIVKGDLRLLSVSTSKEYVSRDPSSWSPKKPFRRNGQNPIQDDSVNLPASAVSRVVGGMGSHWTCCTPRQHDLERSPLFNDHHWEWYYHRAETLFGTNTTSFDDSIRHRLILTELRDKLPDSRKSTVQSMPLACKTKHSDYIEWSCSATILGELSAPGSTHSKFQIWPNVQCMKLDVAEGKVKSIMVKDLLNDPSRPFRIVAKKYVICAGAVLTLGILYESGFRTESGAGSHHLPAMGCFMTEQTLSFCQVILKHSFVEEFNALRETGVSPRRFTNDEAQRIRDRMDKSWDDQDPLPFPLNDPDPQVCVRFSKDKQWHMQIHRDAFGYGEVPHNIDQRVVVDLRSFGYTTPKRDNRVTFKYRTNDGFGMPQPTFNFEMSKADRDRCDEMFIDMVSIARHLGGFLPGAEPKYLPMGSALHICGTYRAGEDLDDSVVDKAGKVHGMANLVLGGCGVIPTGNACNPTLTAAAFALAAADELVKDLTDPNGVNAQRCRKELIEAGARLFKTFGDRGDLEPNDWVARINGAATEQKILLQTGPVPDELTSLDEHLRRIREAVGGGMGDDFEWLETKYGGR